MVSAHCAHYLRLRRCKKAEKQMESIPLYLVLCCILCPYHLSLFFFFRIWNWLVEPVPKVLNRVVQ